MSSTIEIDQLRVGMFIHLDLGWWAHPFALSSFLITSADQIATIRGLGLKRLRWNPEKSQDEGSVEASSADNTQDECPDHPAAEATFSGSAQDSTSPAARRRADLAAQRAADKLCAQQYSEAGRAWKDAANLLQSSPEQARVTTEGLTQSLLDKMMIDGEVCIRMLADTPVTTAVLTR